MRRFTREAAAADPHGKVIYLTADEPDGCFYRFRPHRWGNLPDGELEVLIAATTGSVQWKQVSAPARLARR